MLMRLNFSEDTPIYQQIRNQIVHGIATGRLTPGAQLPTIRSLAEECGVNMMTVSKAYSLLKAEGYIQTDRRAGTLVAPRPDRGMTDQTKEALRLAVSEAKAAGGSLDEILHLCRSFYEEGLL
ncbi:MAG: GntR family transcriptional regulator [Clostridiales bacterium]|nr:GntR family transcriptional regulator [Clostridiales bacterium]